MRATTARLTAHAGEQLDVLMFPWCDAPLSSSVKNRHERVRKITEKGPDFGVIPVIFSFIITNIDQKNFVFCNLSKWKHLFLSFIAAD